MRSFCMRTVILRILSVRLHAQFRGENLSEVFGRGKGEVSRPGVRLAWNIPGLSQEAAAVVEKEFRYLSRSGPVLLTFVTPIVMLFVFGLGGRSGSGAGFLQNWPELGLPVGAAYGLLLLTNLIYNNFGPDAGGIQFFLVSPASFRSVMLGKNVAHMGVLAVELMALWIGVCLLFRPPTATAVLITLSGLLFAAPVNLTAGNLLSLYSPKENRIWNVRAAARLSNHRAGELRDPGFGVRHRRSHFVNGSALSAAMAGRGCVFFGSIGFCSLFLRAHARRPCGASSPRSADNRVVQVRLSVSVRFRGGASRFEPNVDEILTLSTGIHA